MNSETFIFYGIVGSGKGTQVKLLQDFLKTKDGKEIIYAYPGNEYRKIVESGTQTADLVKRTLGNGDLQPDFLTNSIFVNMLISNLSPDKHLIADGYPRTLVQAECFEDIMKFYGRENIKIIYLEVSKEEVTKRMKLRGRHDDTDDGIERRFNEYENKVIPSMNYLKEKSGYQFLNINGEQSVEDVHKDIIKALKY